MTNSSKKVLIISLSGIGNFVMQSPTWQALKKSHPNWELTIWVAPRGTKQLAENDSTIDEVIEMPIKTSPFQHIKNIKKLRKENFDIALVMSPGQLIKSALYMFLAGITQRIGHTYPLGVNRRSHLFLTDWHDEKDDMHDIEQNLRLLKSLNITPPKVKNYQLDIPGNVPRSSSERIVGIHPGAALGFDWKHWPIDNFAKLSQELLKDKETKILIFGGPDEENLKQELSKKINSPRVSVISSSLLDSSTQIKQCHLFITNDSGLMHIAAAVGVPTIGLFGPTNEKLTGPRGPHSFTIRAQDTKPVYNTEQNFNPQDANSTLQKLSAAEVIRFIKSKNLHTASQ